MSIWSRLESVINSYMNDFGGQTSSRLRSSGDPDVDAAYEELNDFLNGKDSREKKKSDNESFYTWRDAPGSGSGGFGSSSKSKMPPEELRADFELLGVPFGADEETCKTAYKKLLKIHHPDRHAGHEENYRKATEKSARINAAVDRIEKWRTGGNIS
jgi:DnaJ-domain-containing protein 1